MVQNDPAQIERGTVVEWARLMRVKLAAEYKAKTGRDLFADLSADHFDANNVGG